MNVALNDSEASKTINQNKKDAIDVLRRKIHDVKINAIKEYLHGQNIDIDCSEMTDMKDLDKFLKINLSKNDYIAFKNYLKKLDKDLIEVTKDLEAGSTTAFSTFVKGLKTGLNVAVDVAAIAGTAALFGNPAARTIAGVSVIVPQVYKAAKNYSMINKQAQEQSADVMLMKLSTVEDGKNNSKKIFLNSSIISDVKEYLTAKGINIRSDDTITFLSDVYDLPFDTKREVLEMINSAMGNRYDVKEELAKNEKTIKRLSHSVKDNVIKPLSTAALAGVRMATTFNTLSVDLTAAALTGIVTSFATGDVKKGVAAAGVQLAAKPLISFIPVDGIRENAVRVMDTINKAETTTAATATMVGIEGVKLVGKGIKYKIKKAKNKRTLSKETDEYNQQLSDKVKEILQKSPGVALSEDEGNKKIIRQLLEDELASMGMEVPANATLADVKMLVKGASKEQRKQITKFLDDIQKIEEQDTMTFGKRIAKFADTSLFFTKLGLAGIGAITFIDPSFTYKLKSGIGDFLAHKEEQLDGKVGELNGEVDTAQGRLTGEILIPRESRYQSNAYAHTMAIYFGKDKIPEYIYEDMEKGVPIEEIFKRYNIPEEIAGLSGDELIQKLEATEPSATEMMAIIQRTNPDLYRYLEEARIIDHGNIIGWGAKLDFDKFDSSLMATDLGQKISGCFKGGVYSSEDLSSAINGYVTLQDRLNSSGCDLEFDTIRFLQDKIEGNGFKIDFYRVQQDLESKGYNDLTEFVNAMMAEDISMDQLEKYLEGFRIDPSLATQEIATQANTIASNNDVGLNNIMRGFYGYDISDEGAIGGKLTEIIKLTSEISQTTVEAKAFENTLLGQMANHPVSFFGLGAVVAGAKSFIKDLAEKKKEKEEKEQRQISLKSIQETEGERTI